MKSIFETIVNCKKKKKLIALSSLWVMNKNQSTFGGYRKKNNCIELLINVIAIQTICMNI